MRSRIDVDKNYKKIYNKGKCDLPSGDRNFFIVYFIYGNI